jgi:hypothetical protein
MILLKKLEVKFIFSAQRIRAIIRPALTGNDIPHI